MILKHLFHHAIILAIAFDVCLIIDGRSSKNLASAYATDTDEVSFVEEIDGEMNKVRSHE